MALAPGGEALQALRGVPCPVALTMGAALGALTRGEPPRAGRLPTRGRASRQAAGLLATLAAT